MLRIFKNGKSLEILYLNKNNKIKRYYLQFSLKDPWLFPSKKIMCKERIILYGWLFFYIGYNRENKK